MRYLLLFLIACIVIEMSGCATFSNQLTGCGNICEKPVQYFKDGELQCQCKDMKQARSERDD